jgi:hypothetical protein
MLERALPIRHSPIAQTPVIPGTVDAKNTLRGVGNRILQLLRFLGEFIAKGGALS